MRSHTGRTSRDACTAVAILNSSPSRSRPLEHRRRGSPSEINRQRKNSARVRPYFPQIVLLAGPIFCLCVCVCLCVPERRPKFGSKTKRGKRLREIVDLGGLPWGGGFQHSGSYPIVVFQHSEVAHKRQKAGHAFRLPSRSPAPAKIGTSNEPIPQKPFDYDSEGVKLLDAETGGSWSHGHH